MGPSMESRVRDRLTSLGCAVAALTTTVLIGWLLFSQPAARLVALGLLLVVLLTVMLRRWAVFRAVRSFRTTYGPVGKDLLFVYTASPHWQPYIETHWLPRWESRAVVLNRSMPGWQVRPGAALWRGLAGPVEHTPVAIVMPPAGAPRVVRFYSAFRDYKHGKAAQLLTKERDLQEYLDALDHPPA